MLNVVPLHSLHFIYNFTDKYFIIPCHFFLSCIYEIKAQPVGIGEIPARGRVINLCNILYLESAAQNEWFEGSCQVDQVELVIIAMKNM